MKKIVFLFPEQEIIYADNVKEVSSPIVGVKSIVTGYKFYLQRLSYRNNLYEMITIQNWELGGRVQDLKYFNYKYSVQEWLKYLENRKDSFEIFLFDSPKELFKWLSE